MQRFVALQSIFKCRTLNRKFKTHLDKTLIRPILLYGAPVWGYGATSSMLKLHVIPNKIIRSIYDRDRYTSNISIYIELDARSLNEEIKRASAKLFERIMQHNSINTTTTSTTSTRDRSRHCSNRSHIQATYMWRTSVAVSCYDTTNIRMDTPHLRSQVPRVTDVFIHT